ncbi:MAG: CoA transferase [Brevundimonas sp.]|uniref:CoA transferase n=1 Tax=Brevundimonas sp. TaxID=1871086 RepID=UPI002736DA0C|nr:CoA transferase [Brevundimonas sp.]MDP3403471.1 CoA transferase [Brevundimonas sp.]
MSDILKGLRLVEASAFVAAPLGGMTLAQMGAEVIRIDALNGGLDARRWPVAGTGESLFWSGLNKGKKSVALDIASPEGRELAERIICAGGDDAGLLLTNFPPRGWLDYDRLKARRGDLIQLTIQGDRHGGSAVDYTVNPAMGLPFLTGPDAANSPVNHVLPAWDLITGQMAAVGLLAGERQRRRSGQGQHVKLALEDVALAVMGHLGFIAEAELGSRREPAGNHLFGAYGRDFVCADGARIMVVGLTGKQWSALVQATGIADRLPATEARLRLDLTQEGDRFKGRHAIDELIAPWAAGLTLSEAAVALDAAGACWGLYRSVDDMVRSHPNCATSNPMFARVAHPGLGEVLTPGIPLDFVGRDRLPPAPPPRLGQHTEEILLGVAGISSGEFAKLHDRGLVLTG